MINIMELPQTMIDFQRRNNMITEIGKESVTVGNIINETPNCTIPAHAFAVGQVIKLVVCLDKPKPKTK